MKGFRILVLLVMALGCLSVQHGWAGDKSEKSQGVDTKATVRLFKEWQQRKTFPDSIPFAYYHSYALLALEGKVQPALAQKIVDFVKSCQKENGGFVTQPTYAQQPNVIFTYYGVKALSLLGKLDAINKDKAIGFILSLRQDDGGIKGSMGAGETANLATTCYGIGALEELGALGKLDKKKSIAYINRYREKGAGFGMSAGNKSTPEASFLGLQVSASLGALTAETKKELADYFLGTRYAGLIKDKKYKTVPNLRAMSYTLEGLHALSVMDKADRASVTTFVESLYVAENGGFGPQPGLGTTPPSTFHGVVCLVRLGRLPDPLARK